MNLQRGGPGSGKSTFVPWLYALRTTDDGYECFALPHQADGAMRLYSNWIYTEPTVFKVRIIDRILLERLINQNEQEVEYAIPDFDREALNLFIFAGRRTNADRKVTGIEIVDIIRRKNVDA